MTKEEIGKILRRLRLSCGMTQKEVAEKLGRKQQIIGHWETGYSQPDANTLFVLCDIYNTTVDEAFGFKKINNIATKDEFSIIKKYRDLDEHGKEMVDFTLLKEWERSTTNNKITKIPVIEEQSHLTVNAAHERTDIEITDEMRKHDDDIMNDDNF